MHDQAIGNMIKLCRRKKQITLQVLSEQTGLSVSYLSTLERGLSSPTIANLNLICEALGITMADLILKLDEKKPVVYKNDRQIIFSNPGYRYESATEGKHQMSCIVMDVYDNVLHSSSSHVVDEVGFVISGSIKLFLNDEEYTLHAGDCIYIEANTKHSYQKVGNDDCTAIWVYAASHATNLIHVE